MEKETKEIAKFLKFIKIGCLYPIIFIVVIIFIAIIIDIFPMIIDVN